VFVFSSRIRVRINISYSLKDKRQVIRSIKDRFRATFKVLLAEVGEQDNRNFSTLGFSFVCEDISYGKSLQQKMIDFIRDNIMEEVVQVENFQEKY